MSANGYEIRMSLLSMAKDMLFEQWHAREHLFSQSKFAGVEDPQVAGLDADTLREVEWANRRPPSPEDVQALALDLYRFVQSKNLDEAAIALKNPSIGN